MALNFQDIPIPFVAGQTQTMDDPLVAPPGVVRLENGEFDDRGNIKVVEGVSTLVVSTMTGETAPSDSHPNLRRVHGWQKSLLIENFDGIFRRQIDGKFAIAAGSNNAKRESLRARRAGVSSIVEAQGSQGEDWNQNRRPNAGTLGVDAAVSGDYTCVVWCEEYGTAATRKQVSWLIRHKDGAVIGRGRFRQNGTDVKEPRVVVFNSLFHVYGLTGGDLGYRSIDPAATQNVPDSLTTLTKVGTYQWMDVALSPTQVGVSLADNAAGVVTFVFTRAAVPVFVGVAGVVAPGNSVPVANFYVDTGGAGIKQAFVTFYACAGSVQTLRWIAVSPAAALIGGAGAQVITPVIARPVAFKDWAGNKNNIPLILDTIGATASAASIEMVRFDATSAAPGIMASGATTYTILAEHIAASLPIVAPSYTYDGSQNQGLLLGVYFSSSQQHTFQVFDIARAVKDALGGVATPNTPFSTLRVFDAGKWADNNVTIFGASVGRVCAPVVVPGESYGVHFWSAKFTPNITNVTDLGQNPTNLQRNTLRFDASLGDQEYAGLLYLGGGTPLCYDGQDVFEEGFTYGPEGTVVAAGAGGPLSAGSYGLVLVYEWFDGQGNRWQSQCGNVMTFTAAAANTYTVTARPLRGSLKSGVQIIPYRTTAVGGAIFYRDSPLGVTPLTDAVIQSSELLYTGPGTTRFLGTQQNNALPGVDTFCTHQKRLVAVGGEDARGFFYSKEGSPRFPGEFNRASGFGQVSQATGGLRAAASLDDKLVLFGTEALSLVYGQGPNLNWSQNGYNVPIEMQATEGIREDTPFVAVVPEGVWYMTALGPRLLSRSLTTGLGPDGLPLGTEAVDSAKQPIGKCEAIHAHPTKPQVYFWSQASSQMFIYDTQRNQWSYRGADLYFRPNIHAAPVGSLVYFVNDNAWGSSGLRFIDPANTDSYALTLETGWVSFAGVQRFQRFTHLQILATERETGTFASTYEFQLSMGVDYNGTVAAQVSTIEVFPLNAPSAPFQCEFQVHRQQSQAYKFVVRLRPPVSGEGGNFALVSMLARVGVKKGGGRLSAGERA